MSSVQTTEASGPNDLIHAFERFNDVSLRLAQSYDALQARVGEFKAELIAGRASKQAVQAESRRLADRLTGLLEILPAAVLLVDGRGRIDRFNQAAEAIFPNLSWGRLWSEVLQECLVNRVNESEWLLAGDVRVSVSRRVLDDQGQIMLLVDVTEQRQLEVQLQRQERLTAIGEMAAQLAHQIRTPLSTAVLYAGQLANTQTETQDRARFGEKLLERLRHTEQLVADMLSFARGGRFVAEPMDVRRILTDAADIVAPRYNSCGATVSLQIAGGDSATDPLLALGNRDALTGSLVNLLNNALDHSGPGISVRLGLSISERRYVISVADDGDGIPAEISAHIFDPFFTTKDVGTGLGLAVVQAVVLDHGGDVRCTSSEQGGALFELTLPRTSCNAEAWSEKQ